VKNLVRAIVTANRRVQDRQTLLDAISRYLPDDANAKPSADAYLAQKVWDVNGAMSPDSVQYMVDFLVKTKQLPVGATPDKVADPNYLNAVLDALGRQ
jgi:hypothetical protein